jgi:hypothetical protein
VTAAEVKQEAALCAALAEFYHEKAIRLQSLAAKLQARQLLRG